MTCLSLTAPLISTFATSMGAFKQTASIAGSQPQPSHRRFFN
jgi:hypothetical protein